MQCWRQGRPQAASPQLLEARQCPGSTPAVPRSFGKLQGRVWGPKGEKFGYSKPSIWAPFARTGGHQHSIGEYFFNYFLIFNNFLSPFFQISRVSLGIFLGSRGAILPQWQTNFWRQNEARWRIFLKQNDGSGNARILARFARFARFRRRRELPPRPYLHARIPRMTEVSTRQTPSNDIITTTIILKLNV